MDLVDDKNNKISKEYIFTVQRDNDFETTKLSIIICNNNMMENMQINTVSSFHFDCTYKLVPQTPHKYRLLLLSVYENQLKKNILCFFVLCKDEKKLTFENIFSVLKKGPYLFEPYYLMCDFAKAKYYRQKIYILIV